MYHPFVSLVHEAKLLSQFGYELFHKLVATSVTN